MFKSLFTKKRRKLYKVVYKHGYGYSEHRATLLVTGNSPAEAIDEFYKRVSETVKDIVEFTEITYGSEGAEIKSEQKY